MDTLASSVRTPAYRQASNWSLKYLDLLTWRLKKLAAAITEVTFGCAHRHITCEFEGRQTCIDCGASRLYIHTRGLGVSKTFKGLWKKTAVASPVDHAIAKSLISQAAARGVKSAAVAETVAKSLIGQATAPAIPASHARAHDGASPQEIRSLFIASAGSIAQAEWEDQHGHRADVIEFPSSLRRCLDCGQALDMWGICPSADPIDVPGVGREMRCGRGAMAVGGLA
jgi:hypothetical protein